MGAVILNKPQINGETKLPAAVRGWNARNDLFRFNALTIQFAAERIPRGGRVNDSPNQAATRLHCPPWDE